MDELHKILTDNISHDMSFTVTVDGLPPKIVIKVFQSVTMAYYMGKREASGFTLYVSIENVSGKGKKIVGELTRDILKQFKTVSEKRWLVLLYDFGEDIDSIVDKVGEILDRLKVISPDFVPALTVSKTTEMHRLE
ncbi:hypothetical protein WBG78_04250 [Chryseolinea sp. T2]|uniref:hypothetical protein n=1 Tax=Chryseolinea sp. T2 TaxID=3129255 RepID=UPI003078237F